MAAIAVIDLVFFWRMTSGVIPGGTDAVGTGTLRCLHRYDVIAGKA